jgi:hypothetical protein
MLVVDSELQAPNRTRPPITKPTPPPGYENISVDEETDRFIAWCQENESQQAALVAQSNTLLRHMPKSILPPIFPTGPLNLNPDGTEINYKKSHEGPNAAYWHQADGEEIERLLTTGTIRPLLFRDIPTDRVVTYVNPVCGKNK